MSFQEAIGASYSLTAVALHANKLNAITIMTIDGTLLMLLGAHQSDDHVQNGPGCIFMLQDIIFLMGLSDLL